MADMQKLKDGLVGIVGRKSVVTDEQALAAFAGTYHGFMEPGKILCMVYATKTEEIQAIVNFVRDEIGCGIVPCSSEDNVKLTGASLPAPGTEAVVLNLSQMKRVFRVDMRNRVAFVEAGVTFAELENRLKGTGLKLDYPFLARKNKSVIATMLDRDPITVPMNAWDINDPLLCLEVVFGDGSVFRTGSAAGPGTLEEQWEAGVAMNNPMGPSHTDFARVLSGSQGTLGIVAWASIKLELDLSAEQMLYVETETVAQSAPVAWQGIRRRLGNNYVFLNDFALGCAIGNDREEIDAIAGKAAKWTLAVNVAGKRRRPEQKVEFNCKDLKTIARQESVRKRAVDKIAAVDNLSVTRALTGLNEGKRWKHRYAGEAIDIFFLTTLDAADTFTELVERILPDGMKYAAYIQPCMQGRYCHVEYIVPYSEENKGRAKELYLSLMDAFLEAGAFFSRPYGVCTNQIFEKAPMQVTSIGKLKKMFDPQHILNPNRFFEEV
ncbi:MAG: FAD-binding oxidoreductase [Lachnospiraceae bacterium]|nr:FAD-binding oxidoreductase [Lachnospiraceae bacterium]